MEQHIGFIRSILVIIAIGIWLIVFQNFGIFPRIYPEKVEAVGLVEVKGIVEVDNVVFVKGRIDANIESINGYSKFYKDPRTGEYYVLPVTDPYD